jgi:hypothetical protein
MSQVGELNVRIGADTSGLTKGVNDAKTGLSGLDSSVNKSAISMKELATVALAVGAATAVMVRNAINAADEMGKAAQRVGVTTQELSKLQYAAKLAGISSGELQGALSRLTKGMSDASQGTGEAQKGFQALGIQVSNADGSLKSSADIMGEVADRFSTMQDGANKTAIAISIFGRAGASMIPLLNGGKNAIKDAGDELEKMGGVITPEAAKQAEIFNDNLTRMAEAAKGAANVLATALLPTLNKVLTTMLAINEVKAEKGFWRTVLGLTELGQLIAGDEVETAVLEKMRSILKAQADAVEEASKPGKKGAAPALLGDLNKQKEELQNRIAAIQDSLKTESQLLSDKYQKDQADLKDALAKKLITEEEYNQAIQALQLKHQEKLWDIEATSPEALRLQKLAENVIALENSLKTEEELLIADYERKHELLAEFYTVQGEITAEGKAVMEALELDHQEKLTKIAQKAAQDRVRQEQFAQNAIFSARAAVVNASVGLLNAFAGKSKAAAMAAVALGKALAIAQIIQSTAAAQMRAMAELGPIAGPPVAAKIGLMGKIQAGIVAATGLMEMAGAAGGGGGFNINAAGPTSGGVNTGTTSGGGGGGGGGITGQTVTIQLQGEVFGREQVRSLITQINEAVSDGSVLRLA